MAKPSAAELQKAAKALDLAGFDYEVTLETSAGPIRLALDSTSAPGHVRNMVALAESGYYDGGCFHRIIKGFMIQGGCPQGTGTGGPGYTIPAEFNRTQHEPGVLSIPTRPAASFSSAWSGCRISTINTPPSAGRPMRRASRS